MPIKIADRTRPFSRVSGVSCPIPYSSCGIQIFPAVFCLLPENRIIPLQVEGPVEEFISTLDLERGVITVSGRSHDNYFRYHVFSKGDKICFYQDRGKPVLLHSDHLEMVSALPILSDLERISFGVAKKLDWELVKRRRNLGEILPVWYRLGQCFPEIAENNRVVLPSFLNLFDAGFSGIFYPAAQEHLGFHLPPIENPIMLLTEGYKKIRSHLCVESDHVIEILPSPLSPCGRATGLKTSFGTLDIEWTKHFLRQMTISCHKSESVLFKFPKSVKACRLLNSSGLRLQLSVNSALDLRAGTQYFLSHFQE